MKARVLASIFLALIILSSNVETVNALTVFDVLQITPLGFIYDTCKQFADFLEHYYNLEDIANWTYMQTKTDLLIHGAEYTNSMTQFEKTAEFVKYYALARAEAVYAQELGAGADKNTATNKAIQAAEEVIDNTIKNLIEYQNVTVLFLEKTLPHYKQVCDLYKYKYNISSSSVERLNGVQAYNWWDTANTTETYKTYTYKVLIFHIYDYHGQWRWRYVRFKYISIDNKEVYNYTLFKECLDKLINDRQWVVDNLVNYFMQVNQLDLDVSEIANMVLDPYAVLTMAQNNSTNYYAWSAYKLALLGLKTNMSAPITIDMNGTQYSGYLFTSDGFNSTLTVNGTYTVPQGESVYLLTPDGKIIALSGGETFKLVSARDQKTGQELTNLTLTRYVDTSPEATKILEDVEKLIELYNKTLELQTTAGGGGSGSSDWANTINNFWGSLSWEVKAVIIGGGILTALVLIGRSFGRGGVSVLKVEEPK